MRSLHYFMRRSLFSLFLIILALGLCLYHIKEKVRSEETALRTLNKEILRTHESLHLINAEWQYLTSPKRLETLNKRYLGLKKIRTEQIHILHPAKSRRQALVMGSLS